MDEAGSRQLANSSKVGGNKELWGNRLYFQGNLFGRLPPPLLAAESNMERGEEQIITLASRRK